MSTGTFRLTLAMLALLGALGQAPLEADPGDLVADFVTFAVIAPQDITYDETEDCFWITTFLDERIYKYNTDLTQLLDTIPSPFLTFEFTTGITWNPLDDTLLVTNADSGRIVELDKLGVPTGREISIPFLDNPRLAAHTVRGLAFDPGAAAGTGSIYVVETLGTLVYEISLEGELLRSFVHPEDPDGFPGRGQHTQSAGIDLIHEDGELSGFWITGIRGRQNRLYKLDAEGSYTGLSFSLDAAGGTVSGIVRHPFPGAENGGGLDSFICVVESNARLAVLEAGEPENREIFGLECDTAGNLAMLRWSSRENYDRVEIIEGCRVHAVLPGDATSWEAELSPPGLYELSVRAMKNGTESIIGPCLVLTGPGQILRSREVGGRLPIDLASNGDDLLVVTDGRERELIVFEMNSPGDPVATIPVAETFASGEEEEEYITGIARGPEANTFFVYNTTRHIIGLLDLSGSVLSTFEVALPNLNEEFDPEDPESEEDLGTVMGMVFDPAADEGRGALWITEVVEDIVYQVDLEGRILKQFHNPYTRIQPPPIEDVFNTYTGGISRVPGRGDLLWLSGGTYRDFGQKWIALVDTNSGEVIPGSEITTASVRRESRSGSVGLENILADGESRFFVLGLGQRDALLAEILHEATITPAPGYLECRQPAVEDRIILNFINNGPYDSIEVLRDCELIASLAGDAVGFVDEAVTPGIHEYGVRGIRGGIASETISSSVRVGIGAVLQRSMSWPARSPQQLTRDPVDGSFYACVNWYGEERKVYHYDAGFRFLDERDSVVEAGRQIATLAIRAPSRTERLLYYITWLQPVPLGEVDTQRFFLASETLAGQPYDQVEIVPPVPENGFIIYPTGLTWDSISDSFFYLERNSRTFLRIDTEGNELGRFPHPEPPYQNFVFNLGLAVNEQDRTLLFTTSAYGDHGITKVLEMNFEGNLTGFELPLTGLGNEIRDIELYGRELVAIGSGSFSELLRIKFTDTLPAPFLRGDADSSGEVNLTDAIYLLGYLFQGVEAPACLDSGDFDDDGRITLTDAILTLNYLFRGGIPPAAPFPGPGQDPTADGLQCR